MSGPITPELLKALCPLSRALRLAAFVEPLNATLDEFEINTPKRQRHFLTQLAHESGGFRYVRELASGDAYNDRADLGNTSPEAIAIALEHQSTPGRWWRGAGLMQITGARNMGNCSERLYGDRLVLLHNPHFLERPMDAARSAGWFWTQGAGMNLSRAAIAYGIPEGVDLNELADSDDLKGITLAVNGGLNGYEERRAFFNRAQGAIA